MAISAVDLALWDLIGKVRQEPVYNLIGGLSREEISFYCTGLVAEAIKALGFWGAKVPHGSGPYSYHFIASQTGPAFCEYVAASPDGRSIRPVFGDLFVGEDLPKNGKLRVSSAPVSAWNWPIARCWCRSSRPSR